MTTPALDAVRLTLHVLAACIWVGGQFTVAGLLPTVRSLGPDATKKVARALARLLWPAYLVLLLTGFWNVAAVHSDQKDHVWQAVLAVKIGVVVLSGVAAYLHQRSTSRRGLAVWGAVSGVTALGALALGVVLAG